MNVEELMTREVLMLSEDSTIRQAVKLIASNGVSGIPVVDDEGRIVGLVSQADLLPRWQRKRFSRLPVVFGELTNLVEMKGAFARASEKPVSVIMTHDVVTARADEPLAEAAIRMSEHGVKRLPVVDGENRVIGVFSRIDLIRHMAKWIPEDEEG